MDFIQITLRGVDKRGNTVYQKEISHWKLSLKKGTARIEENNSVGCNINVYPKYPFIRIDVTEAKARLNLRLKKLEPKTQRKQH